MVRLGWLSGSRAWAGLAAGLLAFAGWGIARADGPRAAELVAGDAVVYLEASRPGALLDRLTSQKVQNLLGAVPGYQQAFQRDDIKQGKAVVEYVASLLGTTWDKGLRDLSGGGVVLAVEVQGKPRILLAVTPGDAEFLARAHAKLLELARKDASDKGKPDPVKETQYRGLTAYSVNPEEAHAVVDGVLLITNGGDWLKTIIDRTKDGIPSPLAKSADWQARRAAAGAEALAWGVVRLDRLRALDPKRFGGDGTPNPGAVFIFGPWLEAIQKAPWASASLTWTDAKLGASLTLATPPNGVSKPMQRYLPPKGQGASTPLWPRRAIASLSLWRDFSAIWEVRSEILPPEAVQGLAQLDTTAGTFFGGRDFGTGVLGAIGHDWRLVVADQDFDAIRPQPDQKLPAFALVVELKPDDEEFAIRLKSAFQSFIGLVNLGAAQSKAPPLLLGSETFEGVTIATSQYQAPKDPPAGEPVTSRFNFSPSSAQVENTFILSSSLGLTRDLITSLKSPAPPTGSTLVARADGAAVARLLELNKTQLVSQNMLQKGNAKAAAEGEINLYLQLLRYLGRASLSAEDRPDAATFRLDFQLDAR